jgi:hypothetical protein
MFYLVDKVITENDRYGNPRRLYRIREGEPDGRTRWVREHYRGKPKLGDNHFPFNADEKNDTVRHLDTFNVPVSEFARLDKRTDEKVG